MWMLLLKICLLTTLFYSLYHWALRGNTFFRFNRVYLLAGMFIALALPFIPLYYAVPTVSETDLPETAFRIGNIISIEMKVNESVNFSQIGCLIYISGLIVLLLSRMWTVFRLFRCIRNGSKEVFCGIVSIETPMVQSSFSFLRYIVLPQGIKEVDKNVILAHEETHIRQWHCVDLLLGDIFVSYSGSTLLLGCINVTWWKTMSFWRIVMPGMWREWMFIRRHLPDIGYMEP